MAVNWKKRTQSDNQHLGNMTTAQYVHIDGGVLTPIDVFIDGGRLLKVIVNTNGATLNMKSGIRQIGTIATDAPEGSMDYGIYCENGLTVQASGACSMTVVFSSR